jgi:hypothetical protein
MRHPNRREHVGGFLGVPKVTLEAPAGRSLQAIADELRILARSPRKVQLKDCRGVLLQLLARPLGELGVPEGAESPKDCRDVEERFLPGKVASFLNNK